MYTGTGSDPDENTVIKVTHTTGPVTPTKPEAGKDFDPTAVQVNVRCVPNQSTHAMKTYSLEAGTYEISDPYQLNGFTAAKITVDAETYLSKYNTEYGAHEVSSEGGDKVAFDLIWDAENNRWDPTGMSFTFSVRCVAPVPAYIYTIIQPVDAQNQTLTGQKALNDTTLARVGLNGGYNSIDKAYITIGRKAAHASLPKQDLSSGGDYTAVTDNIRSGFNQLFGNAVSQEALGDIRWYLLQYFAADNWNGYENGKEAYHLNGNLTFYAVRFERGTEDSVTAMPVNAYGEIYDYYLNRESFNIPDTTPLRTGYTFLGWELSRAGMPLLRSSANDPNYYQRRDRVTMTAGDATLTAAWTENRYTVRFNANGGDGTMEDQAFVYDAAQKLKKNAFTRTGYTFAGWKDAGGNSYTDEQSVKNLTAAADGVVELTAQWTPVNSVSYTVMYVRADAPSAALAAAKTVTGQTFDATVTETAIAIPGYTVVAPATQTVKLDTYHTVITFRYSINFYTVTFNPMGGSAIAPQSVAYLGTAAKPADPTRTGYWFTGWYTDRACTAAYDFAAPVTGDITLYAGWSMAILPGAITKKAPKLNTADHFAYVQGYPDGTVKPAGNITRAETAAILFRLMDDTSRSSFYSTRSGFRDVAAGSWYNTYVATLNNAGVITDSANGYFRPNDAITRAELAAMLAQFSDAIRAANYFTDVPAYHWAAAAIARCAKLGWINGYPDGTFRPDDNVTRAELMAMLNRATGRAPKSADAFLSGMKTWSDNAATAWYYLDVQEATNSHAYRSNPSEYWTALTAAPNWSRYE